ncbi:MAG: leucine-rich repeat protein [Tannerella sp.]|jgi:hypothetical protein|nr:leucine-rich repeat protein [Tannerella sp.]
MKKITRHLIQACAAVLLLSINASAAIKWTVSDDGTLTVSGTGPMEDDLSHAPWYTYRENIRKIVISDSITTIGNRAFADCTEAVSVTIPASVKRIGTLAFYRSGIVSLVIPDSVTEIGPEAFAECPALKDVTLPDTLESLAADLFRNAYQLERIRVPRALQRIGAHAFFGCSSLQTVALPASVKRIGTLAFYGCTALRAFTVDSGNVSFRSEDGVLFNGDKTVLLQYPVKKTETFYKVPDSVTLIERSAFSGAEALTAIVLPASVVHIGDYAFENCTGLTSFSMPDSVKETGAGLFRQCRNLKMATLSASLKSVENGTFRECTSLTSVLIPASVITIGNYAFVSCSALTAVTIPASVKEIGTGAFQYCKSLSAVTLPASVASIGFYAFDGCTALTLVNLPASVESIGNHAFTNCTALTAFAVDAGNPFFSAAEGVLFDRKKTELLYCPAKKPGTSYRIPDSVGRIAEHAFEYCDSLASVIIPGSVYNMEDRAFAHCTGLKSITVSWPNPFVVNYGFALFDSVRTSDVTLEVPEGTEMIYRQINTWADFMIRSTSGGGAVEFASLQLYPNPANGHVTLSGLKGGETIHVCDMSGRSHLTFQASASHEKIAVGRLPAGIYLVRIIRAGEFRTLKLAVY